MKKIRFIKGLLFVSTLTLAVGCTNLNEEVLDGVKVKSSTGASGSVDTGALLAKTYEGLRDFNGQGGVFTLDEMSTDALAGPTRGGDWDDNGALRQMHTHTWAPDHIEVKSAWNSLLSNVYNCNVIIEQGGTASQIVEARFLRAFYYFNVVDLFGQAPYRPAGSALEDDPKVWTRTEATKCEYLHLLQSPIRSIVILPLMLLGICLCPPHHKREFVRWHVLDVWLPSESQSQLYSLKFHS